MSSTVRVFARVRPLIARELSHQDSAIIEVSPARDCLRISEPSESAAMAPYAARTTFSFDHVFPESSTQQDVYEHIMPDLVRAILQGYNASVFAYGQTSSGKSYTISGVPGGPSEGLSDHSSAPRGRGQGAEGGAEGGGSRAGLTYRTVEELFSSINELQRRSGGAREFVVSVSYLQIYNEQVGDLLNEKATNLRIREIVDPSQTAQGRERPAPTVYVENLSEYSVTTAEEVRRVLAYGSRARTTAATRMNADSSRSHSVFTLTIRQRLPSDPALCDGGAPGAVLVSRLNIIDLAGSERLSLSKVSNERLEETKKINTSLTVLGNVIAALAEQARGKRIHIAYRDSKLTRLLQNSLGGNSITVFIATVSPSCECYSESLNTLKFATRVKKMKNKVFQNEILDKKEMVRRYEQEIADLKAQLAALEEADMAVSQVVGECAEGSGGRPAGSSPGGGPKSAPQSQFQPGALGPAEPAQLTEVARQLSAEQTTRSRLEKRLRELQDVLAGQGAEPTGPAEPAGPGSESSHGPSATLLPELQQALRSPENERLNAEAYRRLLLKQKDIIISLMSRLTERDRELYDLRSQLDIEANYQEELESDVGDKFDYLRELVLRALSEGTRPRDPDTPAAEAGRLGHLLAGMGPDDAFDGDGDLSEALLLRLGINKGDYCVDGLLEDGVGASGMSGMSGAAGIAGAGQDGLAIQSRLQARSQPGPKPLPEAFNASAEAEAETGIASAAEDSQTVERASDAARSASPVSKMSATEKVEELRRLLSEKEAEAREVSKRLASAEASCTVALEALRRSVADLASSALEGEPRVTALAQKQAAEARQPKQPEQKPAPSQRVKSVRFSDGLAASPPPAAASVDFGAIYASMRQERGFLVKIFRNKLLPMGERLRRLLAEGRREDAEAQLKQLRGLVEATADALRSSDVCAQVRAALEG